MDPRFPNRSIVPTPRGLPRSTGLQDAQFDMTMAALPPRATPVHQLQLSLSRRREVPLREVDFLPSQFHVVDDQPRDWSDAAVPRPLRLVGMAVVARASQPRRDSGRSRNIAFAGGLMRRTGL